MPEEQKNTDSTSFASILAGVQRLRGEEAGSSAPPSQPTPQRPPQQQTQAPVVHQRPQAQPRPDPSIGTKRVNAFNQDRTRAGSPQIDQRGSKKPSQISVNKSQEGNPLLQAIKNVNWAYAEARNPYDYLVNNREVIFLSLRYHKLHPEYIGNRMKALMRRNAILLTVVDVENSEQIIRELNKLCLFNEFTLILAFTFEQAGKYISFMATTPSKVIKRKAPAEP
ncbi:DNA repair protein RAD10 [Cyberlindnera fabianii]|uniref:DNA repair protein RAD10 n=1 Tax=Cyberlindnera fabianii TaxID=36022 RepID=A0A1V2KZD5_CYBFA|nr:DNA repair protein RAD10 [Cyberlindnera fabianii]